MIKRSHPPVPPAARILAHPKAAENDKERLWAIMETADPVRLLPASAPNRKSLETGSIVVGSMRNSRSRWSSISRASPRT